jgi:hypothetical protein
MERKFGVIRNAKRLLVLGPGFAVALTGCTPAVGVAPSGKEQKPHSDQHQAQVSRLQQLVVDARCVPGHRYGKDFLQDSHFDLRISYTDLAWGTDGVQIVAQNSGDPQVFSVLSGGRNSEGQILLSNGDGIHDELNEVVAGNAVAKSKLERGRPIKVTAYRQSAEAIRSNAGFYTSDGSYEVGSFADGSYGGSFADPDNPTEVTPASTPTAVPTPSLYVPETKEDEDIEADSAGVTRITRPQPKEEDKITEQTVTPGEC